MLPSEFVLSRRVRSGDLASTNLPLYILRCEDRKAVGYAEDKLEKNKRWPRRDGGNVEEIYNQRLQGMQIGVRLADVPPAVSYLAILGAHLHGEIVAIDKTVIVVRMGFTCEGASSSSYLIYDAVALSLRMIPALQDPSWQYTLSSRVSVARPCHGSESDYALVHTGRLGPRGQDSFSLWRPSSSSPPWSEYKKASLLARNGWSETDMPFSFNGHTYRVDLLRGVLCSSCDPLFDDESSSVMKFIPLPVEPRQFDQRRAEPDAYQNMGVVCDSFIRFISIDGIHEYVELKDRTVTVWKLVDHDKGYWKKEHELSMETLWGLEGFGNVPKDLTPMYPLLSTKDTDVVYLGLGGYRETKIVRGSDIPLEWEFLPYYPCYMLVVDMRNKIVRTSLNLDGNKPTRLVSCGLSRYLRKALLGPCDDEGVPIPGMKKPRRKKKRDGGNVAEATMPMKKSRKKEKA